MWEKWGRLSDLLLAGLLEECCLCVGAGRVEYEEVRLELCSLEGRVEHTKDREDRWLVSLPLPVLRSRGLIKSRDLEVL